MPVNKWMQESPHKQDRLLCRSLLETQTPPVLEETVCSGTNITIRVIDAETQAPNNLAVARVSRLVEVNEEQVKNLSSSNSTAIKVVADSVPSNKEGFVQVGVYGNGHYKVEVKAEGYMTERRELREALKASY